MPLNKETKTPRVASHHPMQFNVIPRTHGETENLSNNVHIQFLFQYPPSTYKFIKNGPKDVITETQTESVLLTRYLCTQQFYSSINMSLKSLFVYDPSHFRRCIRCGPYKPNRKFCAAYLPIVYIRSVTAVITSATIPPFLMTSLLILSTPPFYRI